MSDDVRAAVEALAHRCYPGLKKSGLCSKHREDGNYECTVCYPRWLKLIDEHMVVRDAALTKLAAVERERDEWRRKYESIVATLSAYCNSATNPTTHQVVFNVLRKHGER